MWNKLKNLLQQTFNPTSVEDQVTVFVSTPEPEPEPTPFETAAETKVPSSKKRTIEKKAKAEYSSTPVVKRLKKKK